ncbi:MAG: 3-carboxy-cis,cis-muconate cycloisomerase [Rhodobacteraceae bacterium]|nr:MAG: 3-carboxy-cis,cis-muconate cycloisomerase [Paracoccaceae bacterium]
MTPAPFTSALTAPLFGDAEAAEILSDQAFIAHMITVEAALARACAAVGLVRPADAEALCVTLAQARISPEQLGTGMASAGVPVPALVAELRKNCGAEGQALHWGATSQDIVDCAHVLQWCALADLLAGRLSALLDAMAALSAAQADTVMAGRTRSQIATPITLGLRIATWAQPLITLEAELPDLKTRLMRVQFGGSSGSGSAVGEKAGVLSMALAQELGLAPAPCWHLDRSGPQALGAWLVRLSASLGKLARDLSLAGRSEIGEIRAGTGGGSSTMPQKSNPVSAEAVISLAQYTTALQPLLAQAAMAQEERDGAAWALEWLALPQMGVAASAGLRHAHALITSLQADLARMAAHLDAGQGAVMAEAASFALARHMPRAEAGRVVKQALEAARNTGTSLAQVLREDDKFGALEDWTRCLAPESAQPAAEAMRARIWALRDGPDARDRRAAISRQKPESGD